MRNPIEFNLPQENSSQNYLDKEQIKLFSTQFSELRTELYAYLISHTGGDASAAEDCLQEIALVLWNKHDPNWKMQDFRCYAYKCASIEARAHNRKNHTSNKVTFLSPDIVESLSSEVMKCEQEDSNLPTQRLAALKICMNKLTENQKALLEARYNKAESPRTILELAEHHGWKVDTVYKRLERLRVSLYQCILKRIRHMPS